VWWEGISNSVEGKQREGTCGGEGEGGGGCRPWKKKEEPPDVSPAATVRRFEETEDKKRKSLVQRVGRCTERLLSYVKSYGVWWALIIPWPLEGFGLFKGLSCCRQTDGFLRRCKPWRRRKYCCQFVDMLTTSDVSVRLPVFRFRSLLVQILTF